MNINGTFLRRLLLLENYITKTYIIYEKIRRSVSDMLMLWSELVYEGKHDAYVVRDQSNTSSKNKGA